MVGRALGWNRAALALARHCYPPPPFSVCLLFLSVMVTSIRVYHPSTIQALETQKQLHSETHWLFHTTAPLL